MASYSFGIGEFSYLDSSWFGRCRPVTIVLLRVCRRVGLYHFPNQPAVILLLRAGVRLALLAVRFSVEAGSEEFRREPDTNDLLNKRRQSGVFHNAPFD